MAFCNNVIVVWVSSTVFICSGSNEGRKTIGMNWARCLSRCMWWEDRRAKILRIFLRRNVLQSIEFKINLKEVGIKVDRYWEIDVTNSFTHSTNIYWTFIMGGSDGKESACNVGDLSSVSELGRSPGEGTLYPLQYSCLENSMDRGVWWATVHGVTKSQTQLKD